MRVAANENVVKPQRGPAGLFLFGVLGDAADPLKMAAEDAAGRVSGLLPTFSKRGH